MNDSKKYSEEEWHKINAVNLFYRILDLIDKTGRTQEKNDEMIPCVYVFMHPVIIGVK